MTLKEIEATGFTAWANEKTLSDNPHERGSAEALAWEDGWKHAHWRANRRSGALAQGLAPTPEEAAQAVSFDRAMLEARIAELEALNVLAAATERLEPAQEVCRMVLRWSRNEGEFEEDDMQHAYGVVTLIVPAAEAALAPAGEGEHAMSTEDTFDCGPHSPEPWDCIARSVYGGGKRVGGAKFADRQGSDWPPNVVFIVNEGDPLPDADQMLPYANAKRIVAAVNAVAGIPQADLETLNVAALRAAAAGAQGALRNTSALLETLEIIGSDLPDEINDQAQEVDAAIIAAAASFAAALGEGEPAGDKGGGE